MRRSRTSACLFIVAVPLALLSLVFTETSAIAACTPGYNGVDHAQDSEVFGAYSQHKSYQSFDSDTGVATVEIDAGGLEAGRAADSWFDWSTNFGHFDARMTREWVSYNIRDGEADDPHTELLGAQKEAGCVWDTDHDFVSCKDGQHHSPGCTVDTSDVNPVVPNKSTRAWTQDPNGYNHYYDGGDPYEFNS